MNQQCFANFLFCGNFTLAQIAISLHFSSLIMRHFPKLASLRQLFVAQFDEKSQGKQSVCKLCCLSQKRKFARHLSETIDISPKLRTGHKFRQRGANQTYWHEVLETLKRRFVTSEKNPYKKGQDTFCGKQQEAFCLSDEKHTNRNLLQAQEKLMRLS